MQAQNNLLEEEIKSHQVEKTLEGEKKEEGKGNFWKTLASRKPDK